MPSNSRFSNVIHTAARTRMFILTLAAISMTGCFSSKTKMVDKKYITLPVSYTDETSRQLALGTFNDLRVFYEDYQVGAEDVLEISIFEWELREETKSVVFLYVM